MSYARKRRLELLGSARAAVASLIGREIPETEDAFLAQLVLGPLFTELYSAMVVYVQSIPPTSSMSLKSMKFITSAPKAPTAPNEACSLLGDFCRSVGVPEQAIPFYRDLINESDINKGLLTFPLLEKQFPHRPTSVTSRGSPALLASSSTPPPQPATPASQQQILQPVVTSQLRALPSPPAKAAQQSPSPLPVSPVSPSPAPTSPVSPPSTPQIASNPSYNRKDVNQVSADRQIVRAQDRKQREIDEQLQKETQWRQERGLSTTP